MMGSLVERHQFQRASFDILLDQQSKSPSSICSLPGIIQHNALHNPDHTFCIQCKQSVSGGASGLDFISVTLLELKHAVDRCCQWLVENISDIHPAEVCSDGTIRKSRPVALFMESDVGLFIHIAALLTLKVPVRPEICSLKKIC